MIVQCNMRDGDTERMLSKQIVFKGVEHRTVFFFVSEPINEIQECVVLMNLHIQTNTYNVCRNTNRVIKNLKQKQQMKWLKNTIGLEWNGHCIYKIEVIITKWDRQAWRNLYIYMITIAECICLCNSEPIRSPNNDHCRSRWDSRLRHDFRIW